MTPIQHGSTLSYRFHVATVCICVISGAVTLVAAGLETFFFHKQGVVRFGLLATSPFILVGALSFLARHRLGPAIVALAGAIAGGVFSILIFGSWFYEVGEVLVTGTSSYRGAGSWRGAEFVLVPFLEGVFGLPVFLLCYALAWLGSLWAEQARSRSSAEHSTAAARPRE
jgi:hypothetical protein